MRRFTFSPYVIKAKQARTQDYCNLGTLPSVRSTIALPVSVDLLELMKDYLETYRGVYVQDPNDPDSAFRLSRINVRNREISGIIETGGAGISADLYDINLQEVTYTRTTTQAEMHPFYFLMHIPSNTTLGIIILQRFGNEGVRTILFSEFRNHLKSQCPSVTFEMFPLAESALLRQFMTDGRLIEVKAVKYSIPTDRANEFGAGLDEIAGTISMAINASRDGNFSVFLNKLAPFLDRGGDVNELVQLNEFEADTVKVKFTMNGVERTFDLSNPYRAAPLYDITGDVSLAPNGFPEFDSIDEVAHTHLDRFLEMARLDDR